MEVILLFILWSVSYSNICYHRSFNQCGGHGTCLNNGKCKCEDGWVGTICSIYDCDHLKPWEPKVCKGRGNCVGPNKCSCDIKYGGQFCEHPKCFGILDNDPNVCSGHGSCLYDGTCQCTSNFFGKDCSIEECGGNLDDVFCSGNGVCSKGKCNCNRGYFGTYCEHFYCSKKTYMDNDVCSGRGNCVGFDTCECSKGYFGKDCECQWSECSNPDQCNRNGECLVCHSGDILSYKLGCVCYDNFDPPRCTPRCFGKSKSDRDVCNGHGTCEDTNICSCDDSSSSYYSGKACGNWTCNGISNSDPKVCGGHGTCIDNDYCQCDKYFKGHDSECSDWKCQSIPHWEASVCGGKGKCVGPDYCECSSLDYGGEDCTRNACNGISEDDLWVCSGRGVCDIIPGTDRENECVCPKDFRGVFCEVSKCYGHWGSEESLVCSGHGKCIDTDVCKCDDSYYGTECNELVGKPTRINDYYSFSNQNNGNMLNDKSIVRTIQITVYTIILIGVVSFFCLIRYSGRILDWSGHFFHRGREEMVEKILLGVVGIEEQPTFSSSSDNDSDDDQSYFDDTSSLYTTTTASSSTPMRSSVNSPSNRDRRSRRSRGRMSSSIEESTTTSDDDEKSEVILQDKITALMQEELDDSGDGVDELLASLEIGSDDTDDEEDDE